MSILAAEVKDVEELKRVIINEGEMSIIDFDAMEVEGTGHQLQSEGKTLNLFALHVDFNNCKSIVEKALLQNNKKFKWL